MYTSEFWNKVYQEHSSDAPWLTDTHADFFAKEFKKYINTSKPQKILDYGCGNGKIGMHFISSDNQVEFADISDEMIASLNEQFQGKIPTYVVSYPEEIHNKYDCIICCTVLHHINPTEWKTFLQQFHMRLNSKGRLLISGTDEDDAILQNYHGYAPMTGEKCWCINNLEKMIDLNQFKIIDSYKKPLKLEAFSQQRTGRFIILEKKD